MLLIYVTLDQVAKIFENVILHVYVHFLYEIWSSVIKTESYSPLLSL